MSTAPGTDEGGPCRFIASAAVTGSKHLRGRITTRYGKGRELGNFIIL